MFASVLGRSLQIGSTDSDFDAVRWQCLLILSRLVSRLISSYLICLFLSGSCYDASVITLMGPVFKVLSMISRANTIEFTTSSENYTVVFWTSSFLCALLFHSLVRVDRIPIRRKCRLGYGVKKLKILKGWPSVDRFTMKSRGHFSNFGDVFRIANRNGLEKYCFPVCICYLGSCTETDNL